MKYSVLLFLCVSQCELLFAANISTEADLRVAILSGAGSHLLTSDILLTADLPPLPGEVQFTLNGQNHSISGNDKFSLFKCPIDNTILTLENITLKNGFTNEHGAAVSCGEGIAVPTDIPDCQGFPILIEGARANRLIIRNSVIRDNISAKCGGGIFIHLCGEPGVGLPYALIENSAIINNKVLQGPIMPAYSMKVDAEYNNGGGIWVRVQSYLSDVVIRNSTIGGNYAPEFAGGILIGESGGPVHEFMSVKLFHCTIANNNCGVAGGGFWHDHSMVLDHCIVFNNMVDNSVSANSANFAGPGPQTTISWSVIGNKIDDAGTDVEWRSTEPAKGYSTIWENNNISNDPQLTLLPVFIPANGEFKTFYDTYVFGFNSTSPAYNAGDPGLTEGVGATPVYDQRGTPRKRIEFGRIDIGAYEYFPLSPNTPPWIDPISPIAVLEDKSFEVTFNVHDKETAPESLLVTLDNKLANKVIFEKVIVNGSQRTVTIHPIPDYNTSIDGPQTVTVKVQDGQGASGSQTFILTVTPVNDRPILRMFTDSIVVAEPGVAMLYDIGLIGRTDRGDDTTVGLEKDQIPEFYLRGVSNDNFFQSIVMQKDDGVVRFTPLSSLKYPDTARVRFIIKDNGGTANDGIDSSRIYTFIVVLQKGTSPKIEKVNDLHYFEDRSVEITIKVFDEETPSNLLVLTAQTSTNNIVVDTVRTVPGSDSLRTLRIRAVKDYNTSLDGPQRIFLTVRDEEKNAGRDTFELTIDPVNDMPFLTRFSDTVLVAMAGKAFRSDISLLSIVDKGDRSSVNLEQTQEVNFALIDISRDDFFQSFEISSNDGIVQFTPLASLTYLDTVKVRFVVKDNGGTENGGINSSPIYTFMVAIKKGTSPIVDQIYDQHFLEDHSIQITFAVHDKETPARSLLVTAHTASNSILIDPLIVNDSLRTLTIRAAKDYNTCIDGQQVIVIMAKDDDNDSMYSTFKLTIDPVNDQPAVTGFTDTIITVVAGATNVIDFGLANNVDRGDDATTRFERLQTIVFYLHDVNRNKFFKDITLGGTDGILRFTTALELDPKDTAIVRFYLKDDGGIDNGGIDTSSLYSLRIAVRQPLVKVLDYRISVYPNPFTPGIVNQSKWSVVPPFEGALIMVEAQRNVNAKVRFDGGLSIYDVVGNRIALCKDFDNPDPDIFVSRDEDAGKLFLIWNGRNRNGRIVGNGTYLGLITLNDGSRCFTKTIKIGVKQ